MDDFEVTMATASEHASALEVLYGSADQARLVADSVSSSGEPFAGLIVARRGGDVVGAAWAQLLGGRASLFVPPRTLDSDVAAIEPLYDSLEKFARLRHVALCQALLSWDDTSNAVALYRRGFRHAADLFYMVCSSSSFPDVAPDSDLTFALFEEKDRTRLVDIVDRSYVDSLDCPALEGSRSTADVLDGYRQTGDSGSSLWYLVRHAGKDIGCLLLADCREQRHLELVYMGLVAEARGHAFGLDLVRHAQWRAKLVEHHRVVLAVDARNHHAVSVYQNTGFAVWDRRRAYLMLLDD